MDIFIKYYVTYEREIAIIFQLTVLLIAVMVLIVTIGIKRKMKKILKEISTYLKCIIEDEEKEQKEYEKSQKKVINDRQNQIITEVLEEIFP